MNIGDLTGQQDFMTVLYGLVALLPLWLAGAWYYATRVTRDTDLGQRGVFSATGHAVRVWLANGFTLLVIAILVGGLGQLVAFEASEMARDAAAKTAAAGPGRQQALLIASELTLQLVWCVWNCVFGAFAAAATLYFWQCEERKQPASAYGAVNFALNRFSRVMPAHAKAFLFITLGNFIIVPGIWFGLQYAFVDAIATFDYQERSPLARSQKLVQPRLRSIATVFLPVFFFWWLPGQFLHFEFQGKGVMWIAGAGVVELMIYQVIDLVMVQLYLDRFRKKGGATTDAAAGAPVEPAAHATTAPAVAGPVVVQEVVCPRCGGPIDPQKALTNCPFCNTALTVSPVGGDRSGGAS